MAQGVNKFQTKTLLGKAASMRGRMKNVDTASPEGTASARASREQKASAAPTVSGGSFIAVVVVVAILIGAIVMAFGFNRAAMQLPLIVGIPTLGLGIAVLVRDAVRLRRKSAQLPPADAVAPPATRIDRPQVAGGAAGVSELKLSVVFVALVVLFLLLGFPWGAGLFLFGFLLWVGQTGILKAAIVTLAVVVPFYLVFVVVLKTPNFSGLLL